MNPEFLYDRKVGQYRNKVSGRFIAVEAVQRLRRAHIAKLENTVDDYTAQLLNNKLSLNDWETSVAATLKTATVQAYILGKGGEKRMSQPDYGRLGAHLKSEYRYLRGFSQAIADGSLSPAQINARTQLYLNNLWTVYENAQVFAHEDDGFRFYALILGAAEHCPGCIEDSRKGAVKIGSLAPIGTRDCKVNCKCRFAFYTDIPKDSAFSMFSLDRSFGWASLSNQK